MPTGTPIVIGGQVLAESGNTGDSSGPHLHSQAGYDIGTQNTFNPARLEFKPGTVVRLRDYDPGTDGSWGKFITIQVGNEYITYAHLSKINVKVGDKIGAKHMTKSEAYTVVDGYYRWGTWAPPTPDQSEYWANRLATVPTGNQELYETMKKQAAITQKNALGGYVPTDIKQGTNTLFKKES